MPDYTRAMLDLAEFSNDPLFARETLLARLKTAGTPGQQAQLHYRLWEMCQVCGDETAALSHLKAAMHLDPVQGPVRSDDGSVRRIVVLNVPGTFQANAPLAMLLDDSTALYTLWVSGEPDRREELAERIRKLRPDVVILAMGEDARQTAAILEAEAIGKASGIPVLNGGERIMHMARSMVPEILADIPGLLVPPCRVVCPPFDRLPDFPLLVRPVSSHAGNSLARIDNRADFDRYVHDTGASGYYYATHFIDYVSKDGLYRKYRVVFVDGAPYPVHMAIHDDWAIWYYNAKMEQFPERRAEEARFMQDMTAFFPSSVMQALHAIPPCIGLDYFGLDFGVLEDGTLVVFEVETAMIVHDRDPDDIFPYKSACIARIRQAFERMIAKHMQGYALENKGDEIIACGKS
ncbi:hypothetical protein AA0242T_0292 [Acetobacter aceti NRIC 0242]|uniref:ATP-grasp domain-containing protein n=1 Tax=Acetobacter aceti NBRC 14818 TaxID=887700 RepID=A0AB33IGE9_ACEAC|nr:hypothetical protein [Acetobacter aceti]BCK77001.1 hypothetical protein EMQ_2607 [Acetobacter aceti NBRC 14818]GAN56442.1 hypothetical protein Abac_006_170 [Acetobacter aceti NBRC 14818]GBO79590.1 hypothetical protein AA0242T_0292 [Acetobacter aceti NRIC 0242]